MMAVAMDEAWMTAAAIGKLWITTAAAEEAADNSNSGSYGRTGTGPHGLVLVTCGCAAGVAAAFRAPVGGVLFALEEVTSWWRSQLMWRVFFTSAVVAVVVRSAMNWCKSGKCGHFGSGGFIIWDISGLAFYLFGQEDYSFQELLPMAIIGVIGGLLGAFSIAFDLPKLHLYL
ncbi:hypothetical protein B296_00001884 [Ensete ventricosum]|uniref:Chloride channel protein n=1 Tax=Ensete ventricosum TaxID=4639 RepID=A0A427AZM4_ENSVE|nr:hypothetical protein B296_00001884 [Ensete ventricosum]